MDSIDPKFVEQVDEALGKLEMAYPEFRAFRRVPMDMIAEAVDRELRSQVSSAVKVTAWTARIVRTALITIALRNDRIAKKVIGDGGVYV